MSKLSRRGTNRGPITSTQIDGENSNDNDEYLSREERVFKRQLEYAIEMSKKSSSDSSASDQDNVGKKRKNSGEDQDDQVSGSKPSKARKVSESSECSIDMMPPKETNFLDDSSDSFKIINEPKTKGPDESTDTEFADLEKAKAKVALDKKRKNFFDSLDSSGDDDFASAKPKVKAKPKVNLDSTNDDEDFNPKKAVKKAQKAATKSKINSFYSDDEDFASRTPAPEPTKSTGRKSSKLDSDSDDDEDYLKKSVTKKKSTKNEPKKKRKSVKLDSDSDSDFSPGVAKSKEKTIEISDDDNDEDFDLGTAKKTQVKKSVTKKEALKPKVQIEKIDTSRKSMKTPKIEPKPKIETPKIEAKEAPKVIPKEPPKIEPKAQTKIEPKVPPKIESKPSPKIESKPPPKVEKKENAKPATPMSSPSSLGVPKPKMMTMPKWTPPARVNTLKKDSPNQFKVNLSPGFRVGLSRNVKVKPLHPNVKMT